MYEALSLIKEFEGFRAKAYLCPAGVPTIGYGETDNVKLGMTITEAQASELLEKRYTEFETHVKSLLRVEYNPNQLGALTSFAYNLGVGNLRKSTLLRLFNQGDTQGAADNFEKWGYIKDPHTHEMVELPGLMKRRLAEKNLFTKEPA
jgi:lysozyme